MKPLSAVSILIVLFTVVVALSWQMWANPVIDGGREMNTPLRLLRGELLYSQVYYLYGPVAPFFNALLYKLFGIHLNTLYAAGLAGSLLLVLLIFHLGCRFMTAFEAMLAAAAVLLLCIFKQAGNIIFPYSYAALYGTILGTLALAAQLHYLRSNRAGSLIAAGALSGLAFCCKLEFGFAAIASLLALVLAAPRGPRMRVGLIALSSFLIFPLMLYGSLFATIPPGTLIRDTYLIPGSIPAELIYFNKMKLGLNNPGRTLRELVSALALLGGAAAAISLAGIRLAGEPIASTGLTRSVRRLWWMMCGSWGLILAHILLFGTRWDMNPFRAIPLLFMGMIFYSVKRLKRIDKTETSCESQSIVTATEIPEPKARRKIAPGVSPGYGVVEGRALKGRHSFARQNVTIFCDHQSVRALLVVSVYSLVVLARAILRVPGGGAYGAGLLPVPLLLFLYMATAGFPSMGVSAAAAYRRRRLVAVLTSFALLATVGVLAFRQTGNPYAWVRTPRGDLREPPSIALAMNQALDFLKRNSRPGEYIVAFPEGSSLNFLADRPTPMRYEIATPGFLTNASEHQAIRRIEETNVRYVFIFNRPTSEFGPKVFGRDYCRTLMSWIDTNYSLAGVFGEHVSPENQIGDSRFFIKCYQKNATD